MAVLLRVTPAMPRKFREIGHAVISTGVFPLPFYVGKLSYIDETMCARLEGLSMSRNSVDRLTDYSGVTGPHSQSNNN